MSEKDFNINHLMEGIRYKHAYNDFRKNYNKQITDTLEGFNTLIQEVFAHGFEAGKETGAIKGKSEAKMQIMIQAVLYTDLSDELILKILGEKKDSVFQNHLNELRKNINSIDDEKEN